MSGLTFFTRKIVEIPASGLLMSTIAALEFLDTYVHSNSSVILSSMIKPAETACIFHVHPAPSLMKSMSDDIVCVYVHVCCLCSVCSF